METEYYIYKPSNDSPNFVFLAVFDNLQQACRRVGVESKTKVLEHTDKPIMRGGILVNKHGEAFIVKTSMINFVNNPDAMLTVELNDKEKYLQDVIKRFQEGIYK